MAATVSGIDCIGLMRGGSQPKFMRCSDGAYYVVKFPNNPQGRRVLANELLAALLAKKMRLPLPAFAIVAVNPPQSINIDARIISRLVHAYLPSCPMLCFGSWIGTSGACLLDDWISDECLDRCNNLPDFAGMLVFDKWTGNSDARQLAFQKTDIGERFYSHHALMIDNGHCFNSERWDFPDHPRHGLCERLNVYQGIAGMESFEPWLSRIEDEVNLEILESAANEVPGEWYGNDGHSMGRLLSTLNARRHEVRDLLRATVKSLPKMFPNWHERAPTAWRQTICAVEARKNVYQFQLHVRPMRAGHKESASETLPMTSKAKSRSNPEHRIKIALENLRVAEHQLDEASRPGTYSKTDDLVLAQTTVREALAAVSALVPDARLGSATRKAG